MTVFMELLQGGWNALLEYLSAHVLTCLVPAFFIAGAIAIFISQGSVIRYFGPKAKKLLSYSVASVSGTILAVCSCTVLPLFGGIYRRGAGIGPAIAFLYSGPAINILAIVYTARLLGYELGVARIVGALAFAAGIGLIMAFIYRKEESLKDAEAFDALSADPQGKPWWQQVVFLASLVGILVFAASKNWIATGILLAGLTVVLWRWFSRDEIILWLNHLCTGGFCNHLRGRKQPAGQPGGIPLRHADVLCHADGGPHHQGFYGPRHGTGASAGPVTGRASTIPAQHAGNPQHYGNQENTYLYCPGGGLCHHIRLHFRADSQLNIKRR